MTALQDHRGRPRVAVTGIGVKTPAGNDVDTFWQTLVAGRSAAAPLTIIDPTRAARAVRLRGPRLRPDRVSRRRRRRAASTG